MLQVKKVLAVLMLAMAVYMLSKVVPSQISEIAYLLWAMVVVSLIVNLAVTTRKTQYVLSAALSCGLVLSYIAYSDFFRARATLQESFTVVTTSASLERILAQAKLDKRPVLLDYYASWCVACKEMDLQTFSDPLISQKLKDFTLVRVDVSDNNAQTKLLQQRYQVIAPPSLVFIDGSGQVLDNFKVTGFIASDKLGLNLQAIMTDQLKLRGCDATTMNC
jgi:thiol:disulfide interchange protein DsbD